MVDESTIDTNLLYATVDDQVISALKFVERLEKVRTYIFQFAQWVQSEKLALSVVAMTALKKAKFASSFFFQIIS